MMLLYIPSPFTAPPFIIANMAVPSMSTNSLFLMTTFVPPNEAAPLAQAIGRLLADRDLAERMGRAGRERYERHFTLARMAERTYRVIAGGDSGWESSVSGEAGRTVEQAAREAGRTTEAAAGGVETGRAR